MFSDVMIKSGNTFEYLRIAIDDSLDEYIIDHLNVAWNWLNIKVNKENKKVLIHCQQGQSRSVSIATYFLIKQNKMSVNDALKTITKLRPTAKPNNNFVTQLIKLSSNIKQ